MPDVYQQAQHRVEYLSGILPLASGRIDQHLQHPVAIGQKRDFRRLLTLVRKCQHGVGSLIKQR